MTDKEEAALWRIIRRLDAWYASAASRGSNAKANAYADAARLIEQEFGLRIEA